MDEPIEEMNYFQVTIDNISVSNVGFIVFLKQDEDKRVLPIFIGANEAHSIAVAYNNQPLPRPLTHDLLKNILTTLDCELVKVQITELVDNTFYAKLFVKKEGFEDLEIDSRPSDAIALALRYEAPIFVNEDVYENASIDLEAVTDHKPAHPNSTDKHTSDKLKEELEKALEEERYEEAARIRDKLKRLHTGN